MVARDRMAVRGGGRMTDTELRNSVPSLVPSARSGTNVASALSWAARLVPAWPAAVDGPVRLDYSTLERRVAGLGGGLLGLGVRPGAVVAVLALNSYRHLECWLGIPRVGLVLNELNTRLALAELEFVLEDSEAEALIVDDAFVSIGRELKAALPGIRLIHASSEPADGLVDYESLVSAAPAPLAEVRDDDLAGVFYTGGTTGRSKGVMLTHGNLVANAKHMLIGAGLTARDRYLHAGPMFHLADGAATYALTWVGGTHVFVPSFTPGGVANAIETEQVTTTCLVPTMINLLVSDPEASGRDFSSLRFVLYGGSPVTASLYRKASAALGCAMVQAYGMTEASPLGTLCWIDGPVDEEPWATRIRSAGVPALGVEISVRRPDGSVADVDEVGEIWLRGPNIMAGYWRRPEETAAVLTADGWYHSGDAGSMDVDGYLYIVDRLKDMIISGGENIYCAEVEAALSSHPDVLEVAVFGVPDDHWGERVHAAVVLRAGGTATADDLVAHCRTQIAGYKVPRSFDLGTELLPKSGAGKILKRELRAPYWSSEAGVIH